MKNNKVRGGRDIEATAIMMLEENIVKTTCFLENDVHDLTILVDDIDYIVGSVANPTSQG